MSEGVSLEPPGAPLPLRAIVKVKNKEEDQDVLDFHVCVIKIMANYIVCVPNGVRDPLQEFLNLPLSS